MAEFKVGDTVKIADFTHLHLSEEFRGKLEIEHLVDFGAVVVPLPNKKLDFHADDTFHQAGWVPLDVLEKVRRS